MGLAMTSPLTSLYVASWPARGRYTWRCRRSRRAAAPRMLDVALRLMRRRFLAEEAAHDAFVQVWQSSYDPGEGERVVIDASMTGLVG